MKTAMQLMLEDLELRYKVLSDAQMLQACGAIEGTIEYAKSLIIKEKEQIKTAFESGWNWNFNAEKYYNETYNPAPYQHKANEFKDNDRIEINPITGDVKIITNEEN